MGRVRVRVTITDHGSHDIAARDSIGLFCRYSAHSAALSFASFSSFKSFINIRINRYIILYLILSP